MIIEDENKMSSELLKKINNKLYYAFEDFKKFPELI